MSSGFSIGERYVNIVHCGNVSLLVTRLQPDLREMEWITVARQWHDDSAGRAARLLPSAFHMSHNAALVCVNDTLHAFGGQYRNYSSGRGATARGIFHAAASALVRPGESLQWGPKSLQLEGYHAGCVERRTKFAGFCEFDGQFSAVYFNGRFMLFGRANLAASGGARHVQMASAPDSLSSWSRFQLVQLPGVKAGRSDSNIYFFKVQVVQDQPLALFPAVFGTGNTAGIYASTSVDGIEWTRPQRLMSAKAACARTRVHPVHLEGNQLYVFDNIDISEPLDKGATRPYLRRIQVEIDHPTFLDTNTLSVATTFRIVNGTTWFDVPVGRANASSVIRFGRQYVARNPRSARYDASTRIASKGALTSAQLPPTHGVTPTEPAAAPMQQLAEQMRSIEATLSAHSEILRELHQHTDAHKEAATGRGVARG
jgi:hypothetical protein